MGQSVVQEDWFAVFKIEVTVKDHIIKIWLSNIYIFLTADPFAVKLGLMAHHHKLDCFVKKEKKNGLFCYGQGQGHRKGSEFQWMFIWMISPKLLNLVQPNLLWWCIVMGQSVRQDDLFAVFKVKVTLRAHIITNGGFYHIYGTPDLFATKFDVDGISS